MKRNYDRKCLEFQNICAWKIVTLFIMVMNAFSNFKSVSNYNIFYAVCVYDSIEVSQWHSRGKKRETEKRSKVHNENGWSTQLRRTTNYNLLLNKMKSI